MKTSWLLLSLLWAAPIAVKCQENDSLWIKEDPVFAEFDSLLNSSDSLSILSLIDSLLKISPVRSQLALRVGYNSNVNTVTRNLTVNKFGLSPALSYYHKSGVYADASAYWSPEYDPSIYLSIASIGYLGSVTKRWSVLGEYAHYFYSYTDNSPIAYFDRATSTSTTYTPNTPYTNNVQISNYLDAGKFTFRLDYSLLFGKQTGHRLSPVAGLNFSKKNFRGIDRISFFPSVNLIFGSENLPAKTIVTYEPITNRPLEIIYRYRNGLPLFYPKETFIEKKVVWGIMNYALNFPISIALKNWSFVAGYSYNFPQTLPGEDLEATDGGFLSLSLMRYLEFR